MEAPAPHLQELALKSICKFLNRMDYETIKTVMVVFCLWIRHSFQNSKLSFYQRLLEVSESDA